MGGGYLGEFDPPSRSWQVGRLHSLLPAMVGYTLLDIAQLRAQPNEEENLEGRAASATGRGVR